jgi:hypothetical protein
MIVFDLRCANAHVFEAWFASSSAYEEQRSRALVLCPVCDSASIEKAAMAPNIPAKSNRLAKTDPGAREAIMANLAQAQAKLLEQSEWVGRALPDRARAMHLGEEPVALIHGETSIAEATELADEGVSLLPLPFRVVPPSARN